MSEELEFTMQNYFAGLAEGKLKGSKCKKCGKIFVPPRKLCQECMSTDMEWVEFSGKGTLATYSLVHVGAQYFSKQGYGMRKPYCFGVVALEEGVNVAAHIVGPSVEWEYDPKNFKIGMALKVKFLTVEQEGKDPKIDLGFEPAE